MPGQTLVKPWSKPWSCIVLQAFQLFHEVDQEIKDLEWVYNCTDHNVSGAGAASRLAAEFVVLFCATALFIADGAAQGMCSVIQLHACGPALQHSCSPACRHPQRPVHRSARHAHAAAPLLQPSCACLIAPAAISLSTCRRAPVAPLTPHPSHTQKECPGWAERGECTKMPAYMSDHCRLSCKQCVPPKPRVKGPYDKLLTVEELSKEIDKTAAPAGAPAVASPSPNPRCVRCRYLS